MDQSFFVLPPELTLEIFNKLTAVSYVRLRRTCRNIDNFCEFHRKSLHIRLDTKQAVLAVTNSPLEWSRPAKDRVIRVEVELGARYQSRVITPLNGMTVGFLKSASSGFHFEKVRIVNNSYPTIPLLSYTSYYMESFEKAVGFFSEAAVFLKPSILAVEDVSPDLLENLAKNWNLKKLQIQSKESTTSILDTSVYQKTKNVELDLNIEVIDFKKILHNKNSVDLHMYSYNLDDDLLSPFLQLLQDWKQGNVSFEHFSVTCISEDFDESSVNKLREVEEAYYLGDYGVFSWDNDDREDDYNEWWLFKMDKGRWGLINFCWFYDDNSITISLKEITCSAGFSPEDLAQILGIICTGKRIPVDSSMICEELRGIGPVGVEKIVRGHADRMRRYHEKKFVKTWINVIHEIVTNPLEGPRWVLEMKTGKDRKRNFWKNAALLLYQELICPVSQYCTSV